MRPKKTTLLIVIVASLAILSFVVFEIEHKSGAMKAEFSEDGNLEHLEDSVLQNTDLGLAYFRENNTDDFNISDIHNSECSESPAFLLDNKSAQTAYGELYTGLGTQVSGTITTDTWWNISGSPYIVVGDIRIMSNAVLTIEPGVVVKVNGPYSIRVGSSTTIVYSALVAKGSSSDMITFTSNKPSPSPGDWLGIKFERPYNNPWGGNYDSCLEYCVIEYAATGVTAYDVPSSVYVNITSCIIQHCNLGVHGSLCSQNVLIFHNNFIENTQNALDSSVCKWYNPSLQEGNYWDDYNGIDADGDGIGDTPYYIAGGSNADHYPLMEPWENYIGKKENPTISLIILSSLTGEPLQGVKVYIDDIFMGETNEQGKIEIAYRSGFYDGYMEYNGKYQTIPLIEFSPYEKFRYTIVFDDREKQALSACLLIKDKPTSDELLWLNWLQQYGNIRIINISDILSGMVNLNYYDFVFLPDDDFSSLSPVASKIKKAVGEGLDIIAMGRGNIINEILGKGTFGVNNENWNAELYYSAGNNPSSFTVGYGAENPQDCERCLFCSLEGNYPMPHVVWNKNVNYIGKLTKKEGGNIEEMENKLTIYRYGKGDIISVLLPFHNDDVQAAGEVFMERCLIYFTMDDIDAPGYNVLKKEKWAEIDMPDVVNPNEPVEIRVSAWNKSLPLSDLSLQGEMRDRNNNLVSQFSFTEIYDGTYNTSIFSPSNEGEYKVVVTSQEIYAKQSFIVSCSAIAGGEIKVKRIDEGNIFYIYNIRQWIPNNSGGEVKTIVEKEPIMLLFGVYTGQENNPDPLSNADVSVKVIYTQTGENIEFTGKTNTDGTYIFSEQSFFVKNGEGNYNIMLTFSKLGYKSKTITETIEIRKLEINFDNKITPKNKGKVMSPSQLPHIVYYDDSSYQHVSHFLPKGEKATMNANINFNGDNSIQNARCVFHPLMFWKAEDYAKDIVNGAATYNIKVEDGLAYTTAIYEYEYALERLGEGYKIAGEYFNNRILNYYLPINTIFFDIFFKDGYGNYHKVVIKTYPMAGIDSPTEHNLLLPYSKEDTEKWAMNALNLGIKTGVMGGKTTAYTVWGPSALKFIGYAKDLLDFAEFCTYLNKEKLNPEDFPEFTGISLDMTWTAVTAANMVLGIGLPLTIPSLILMPIIKYTVVKYCDYLVDLWKFEKKFDEYANKKQFYDLGKSSNDYRELHNIINQKEKNVFNTPYEIYSWDDGYIGTKRHFMIVNTGIEPLKINIHMINLSDSHQITLYVYHEGGEIVGECWKSTIIEPGCQVKFEYYKGLDLNPFDTERYRNGYICDVIMDYNGITSYFSKNSEGICLKNIAFYLKGRETDDQKNWLFDKDDEIVFGADSWIPIRNRFNYDTMSTMHLSVEISKGGEVVKTVDKAVNMISVQDGKPDFTVDIGKLPSGKYDVSKLELYRYENGNKVYYYVYDKSKQKIDMPSPWRFMVVDSHSSSVTITPASSFNITVKGYNESFLVNATIYKPDGTNETIILPYIGNNTFYYHYENDSINGLYLIKTDIRNNSAKISEFIDYYIKANKTYAELKDISWEIVEENGRRSTHIKGKIMAVQNSTINITIELPKGCYVIAPNNKTIEISLKAGEVKDFEWYIGTKNSFEDYVIIFAGKNNEISDARIFKARFEEEQYPSFYIPKSYTIYLNNYSSSYNIPLEIYNEMNAWQNITISGNTSCPFIKNISFSPNSFSISPAGKNESNMIIFINKSINITSTTGEITLYTNDSFLTYDINLYFINQSGLPSFSRKDLLFINPVFPLNISVNVSELNGYSIENITMDSDGNISGLPILFDISKNGTKSFDLALNESEKEDGIVHLYLKVNNITMDIQTWYIIFLPNISASVNLSNSNPAQGEKVKMFVNISNSGAENATNITVSLTIDGNLTNTSFIPDLSFNHSISIQFLHIFNVVGWHNLSVSISSSSPYNYINQSFYYTLNVSSSVSNTPPNKPSSPNPSNGSSDIAIATTLSWQCSDPDNDTITYDIYFGSTFPLTKVANNITGNSFSPGTLQYSTTYYWKVVAWDEHEAKNESELWHFTTQSILQYTLTTSVDPSGSGTIILNPSGGTYDEGTVVTATANANSGCQFDHWSGDASGSSATVQITMDSDKSIVAHYRDVAPPQTIYSLSPSSPDGNNGWYVSNVTVTLNANDNISGVNKTKYKIDNGNWKKYNGAFVLSGEGEHTIHYYSIDNASNEEETKTITIKIDETKPTTTYSLNPSSPDGDNEWYVSNVTVTLTANDGISGVNITKYKIDNGNWKKYTKSIKLTEGNHTVRYYTIDNAGNEEEIKTITIKIDKTKPTVSIKTPDKGLYFFGRKILPCFSIKIIGKITIEVAANDNISGIQKVEFYVDGNLKYTDNKSQYEWTYDEPALLFHRHTIKVKAIDKAGNTKESDEIKIWIFNI